MVAGDKPYIHVYAQGAHVTIKYRTALDERNIGESTNNYTHDDDRSSDIEIQYDMKCAPWVHVTPGMRMQHAPWAHVTPDMRM